MAVYTPLSRKDIGDFLTRYDVGELASFEGITEGVENTNYLVITKLPSPLRGEGRGGGDSVSVVTPTRSASPHDLPPRGGGEKKFILTLFEQRVNPADLPFYLGFTEWLADRGIACPRPVKGWDGQTIRGLKGKSAALIYFLEGKNNPVITPYHLELTGELVARLHLAAEGFPMTRRNSMSLDAWWDLFTRFRGRADEIAPGLEKIITDELVFLSERWPSGLPSGVVHADIFPDNVFFTGDVHAPKLSGIIDFYFSCNDFWIYDLLICMNAWCFDAAHVFVPERAKALMQAYDRMRPVTEAERKAMPVLARAAAIRFLLTRAHDWLHRVEGAQVNPKDPMEYLAKLRFHQQVKDWRAYEVPSA